MYKDKDKQREAVKAATQRYRAKKGDSALSSQNEGLENARGLPVVDEVSDTRPVIPSCDTPDVIPEQSLKEARKIMMEREGMTSEQLDKATEDLIKRPLKPKRGKDIKCFEDLPPDVQETIHKLSTINGKIDQASKAKRTAAAIKYQHLFPDRYEPQDAVCSGVVTGKPGDADYNGVCTEECRQARGR